MNYIFTLQTKVQDMEMERAALAERITEFRTHLLSSKFQNVEGQPRRDWIATADVQRWLDYITRDC